jgi:histidyl-tRNA synthetase
MSKNQKQKVKKIPSHGIKKFDRDFIIASHFGFTPVKTPEITKEDYNNLRLVKDPYHELGRLSLEHPFGPDVLEKITLLRTYTEWGLSNEPHPILIAYHKPLSGSEHRKTTDYALGLEIMGLHSSAAEAIIIRTALSILESEGFENLSINVNSLGDRESISDFERVIGIYVRKNINAMSAELRKAVKEDIFEVVRVRDPKCEKIHDDAPKSISFLSENSRIHFKEVLEYIEGFDIPYNIVPSLIASPSFCSNTIFEIVSVNSKGEKIILASGFRYSRLPKKVGFKKELPAVCMTLSFKKKGHGASVKNLPKIKFYLIQLGFQAKVKSLHVVDVLRQARVAVAHSLAKDKLQSQLGTAENMRVPFVIIIGQKEALENSVVIRDMSTRVQETVLISNLAKYIKKLK